MLKNKVELYSLVKFTDEEDNEKNVFVLPVQGGVVVEDGEKNYQIITLSSPLGKSMFQKQTGDEVKLITGKEEKFLEITEIK